MDDAWGLDYNLDSMNGRSPNYRKWEGEDEEVYVMESWDQEPEDIAEGEESNSSMDRSDEAMSENSNLRDFHSQRIIENGYDPDPSNGNIPEKCRLQKFQKEADLSLAQEVFGVSTNGVLDSEESYAEFKNKLLSVIEEANKNVHYASFTEDVVHNLCDHLSSNELKRIVIRLSNLQIQKNSSKKGERKKQKGKLKVKLRVEDDIHDYSEYSAYMEDGGYI